MFSRTDEKHQLYDSTPFIEARKKISLVISGENHYNFGKLLSEETKAKMRIPKSEETKN
jgi:hypothetical protein